ncbi:hypothetical protein AC1031_005925 [Aphanomyces cochlioides]|nr:hypothetical protein AC1031_005925 [Aphanomyces cochlioides]
MEGKQRKAAFRFTAASDVDLLEEIICKRPFAADYGQTLQRWEEIAAAMNAMHGEDALTAASCRRKFDDLVINFKRETMKSMRASGTEEDYTKRDHLLQDICEMIDALMEQKREANRDKRAKDKKREFIRDDIREAALKKYRQSSLDDESTTSYSDSSLA